MKHAKSIVRSLAVLSFWLLVWQLLSLRVGKTLLLQDVWSGENFKLKNAEYMQDVEAYGCRMFRARVVDAD